MNKKVLVLPGDGIGKEVCDAALPALEALDLPIELIYGEIGWECWMRDGDPVPAATWQQIEQVDAILLGAITSKPKKQAEAELPPALQGQNHRYVSPVIQLRQRLGLFANVRPSFYLTGNGKPYRMSVIRENTEGLYAGYDYRGIPEAIRPLVKHPNLERYGADEASCTLRLQTRFGLERLFGFAFEHAVQHGFDRVTFADKPNVMRESGDFAQEIFEAVAARYPGIRADIQNVDAVALWLVTRPEQFGVIVAENMFGDILSDLAGGVMGGLGLAPSANYGEGVAYFEPVHGSAPGMVGKDKANPAAMFLSIAMLLEHLGFACEAALLQDAVRNAIRSGAHLTYDLGGSAGTRRFADEVLALLRGQRRPRTAAVLAVGDELVGGEYQNTNSTEIGRYLATLGYEVKEHAVCGDQRHLIARALTRFLGEYDLVLVCGGLGPTSDDLTRFAVADALQAPLEFRDDCWQHITRRMQSFNLPVREQDKVQAYLPAGARALANSCGLASGFLLEKHGTTIAVLPGPPAEMRAMLHATFAPDATATRTDTRSFEWKLLGLIESDAQAFVATLASAFAARMKYLWRYPYLNLRVDVAASDAEGLRCAHELDAYLRAHTVSTDGRSALEQIAGAGDVHWTSQGDAALAELLRELPGSAAGEAFVVTTEPRLDSLGDPRDYAGSLRIACATPSGRTYRIATPLRGVEVRDYVREFAAWCYLRDQARIDQPALEETTA